MKNKNREPRRKRMKRQSRLQAAKHWIPTYTGKNIVNGYKKWFNVDLLCAVKELRILGVKLDEQYVSRALAGLEQLIAPRQKKREQEKQELEYSEDSDENFYFIAGYTTGGFPYGTTWEEAEALGLNDF